jgi:phosphatidylserine/phosphatidylglycerophosphate/cardiolipin synthase-like enzyme
MLAHEQKNALHWWARGDTPVHQEDSRVSYFVDGRSVLFALCCAFLKATYHFPPRTVRGIAQLYIQAIGNAHSFIYLENQYLWVRAYLLPAEAASALPFFCATSARPPNIPSVD